MALSQIVGWIGGLFKVADSSGTERTMLDSDGYIYQRGTKITSTAAQLNGVGAVVTSPDLTLAVESSISLGSGDVTLSAAQQAKSILEVTTGHASNSIIAPATAGKVYCVVNKDGALAARIKKSAGTAVVIAATKSAWVYYNGTEYVRMTADA